MKRPIIWALIFYIYGIIAAYFITDKYLMILALLVSISLNIIIYLKFKNEQILLFPIFTVVGILNLNFNLQPKSGIVDVWAEEESRVTISAVVKDIDYTSTGRQKVLLKTQNIIKDGEETEITTFIQAILKVTEETVYNQKILISGNIKKPDFERNPGGFNQRLYLKTRGIEYTMFSEDLQKGEIIKSFDIYLYNLHKRMNEIYENILPDKEAGILEAMLLGDKKNLDNSIEEIYRQAGISHIIAISGLHVSILSGAIIFFISKLKFNKRISSALVIFILILYCIFTGNSVSTVRAVTMISIGLFGTVIYREKDTYTSIAAAAFFILIYQPLYILDVGFQLSFSAASGMVLFLPVLERISFPRKIKSSLNSVLAAAFSTYPIMAYHFNTVSIIGLLVNLAVLPLAGVVIIFGLLTGIVGIFWNFGAKFLCGIVYYILIFYEKVCTLASSIPFSQIKFVKIDLIVLILYYVMAGIIIYYFNIPKIKRNRRYLTFVMALIIFLQTLTIFFPKGIEIVYLDVGQGDSIAIHTDKYNILIDGGGDITKSIGEENKATEVLVPYFEEKGIKRLDWVFVTHPDGDHILGVIELLDYIEVKKIVVSDLEKIEEVELYKIMKQKAHSLKIDVEKIGSGVFLQLQKDVTLECMYPNKNINVTEMNNFSLVLALNCYGNKFLFTGDIEKEGEEEIIENYDKFDTEVLKVAHHGSSSSSSQKFIDFTNPKTAVVSSGRNNRYNHPSKEVVKRFEQMNIKIYNTAYEGAVIIKINKDRYKIVTMREKSRL